MFEPLVGKGSLGVPGFIKEFLSMECVCACAWFINHTNRPSLLHGDLSKSVKCACTIKYISTEAIIHFNVISKWVLGAGGPFKRDTEYLAAGAT